MCSESAGLTLVAFGASWCGPCRLMAPGLRALASTHKDRLKVAKLDVDANPATTDAWKVETYPDLHPVQERRGDPASRRLYAAAQDRGGARARISRHGPCAARPYVPPAMDFLLVLSAVLSAVTGAFVGVRPAEPVPQQQVAIVSEAAEQQAAPAAAVAAPVLIEAPAAADTPGAARRAAARNRPADRVRRAAPAALPFANVPPGRWPAQPYQRSGFPHVRRICQSHFRIVQRPLRALARQDRRQDQRARASHPGDGRRDAEEPDRAVPAPARRRRDARRPPARGLRHRPRGRQAHARPAPLRRPAGRRHRPPPRRDRRDAHRRGQDPGRDARRLSQRARREGRPRRHRQRLSRPPRRRLDGPDLPLPRPHRRRDRPQPRRSRSAATPIMPTSPTAPTTSSASIICATT